MVANLARNTVDLSGTGAVYHRVSTDKQEADRQREGTQAWLGRISASVKAEHVYEDVGWSRGDADRRPAFQRLLTLVDRGAIQWIVIDRQDRFESRDKWETASNIHRLRKAGCRLYTVDGREITSGDVVNFVQTGLASETSEKELEEKSARVIDGKRSRAKRGEWMGGKVPYGMDVVAFRLNPTCDLVEQWRVQIKGKHLRVKISRDGIRREYEGRNNFPASEQDEILQLRPSTDEAKLDVVRGIFTAYATERTTPGTIARNLNEARTQPPAYSRQWLPGHVYDMLTNPGWIGHPVWNRNTSGKYHSFEDGQRVPKGRGAKPKRHARKDWVMPDAPLFPAVIDAETWERVQAKLESRHVTPRATRSSGYVFSGLVVCGNCGGVMTGSKMPTKGGKPKPLTYLCGTYNAHKGPRASCPCKAYRVAQSVLEDYVRDYLGETGPLVRDLTNAATSHKPENLKAAIKRAVDARKRMLAFLDAELAKVPDSVGNYRTFVRVGDDPELITTDFLEELYRDTYTVEYSHWDSQRDELQGKQDELIETLAKMPATATRAVGRLQQQIDELDAKIRDVEGKLVNAADDFAKAEAEYRELNRAWETARASMESETADRRKAEAIRQVLSKIVVTFKPTGKTQPVGVVEWIEIVPLTQGFSQCGSLTRSP